MTRISKKLLDETSREYVDIILKHQDIVGTFPATGQKDYEYSDFRWVRDASNTSLGLVERMKILKSSDKEFSKIRDSLEANFDWWLNRVRDNNSRIEDLLGKEDISIEYFFENALPTRFKKNGQAEENTGWPLVQLDGYGTFLTVIGEYLNNKVNPGERGRFVNHFNKELNLISDYLSKFFSFPNYDMWEDTRFFKENPALHSSTIACVYAGLKAATELRVNDGKTLEDIKNFVNKNFRNKKGEIVKYIQQTKDGIYILPDDDVNHVDSSMLLLASPFSGLYNPKDAEMKNISQRVEEELTKDGGVKRYPADEFYGGGYWPILSALQGMFYLDIGENEKAIRNAEWIMNVHDKKYELIEQVKDPKNEAQYKYWCKRFGGEPTKPLLMNHGFSIAFFEKLRNISGLK